jgi:hypothetical protein
MSGNFLQQLLGEQASSFPIETDNARSHGVACGAPRETTKPTSKRAAVAVSRWEEPKPARKTRDSSPPCPPRRNFSCEDLTRWSSSPLATNKSLRCPERRPLAAAA